MDLSVLIPARNEMFLARTIRDIVENARGKTEVVAVLDGSWPHEPVEDRPNVHLIYHSTPIGQRAATNEAARFSRARYLMKVDAHCAFDEGFDVKLMADMRDDWTMVPVMRNLHAFDWVCESCGERRYQGPSGPCGKCGGATRMDVVWIAKTNPQSTSYCFDSEPHFQYFKEFARRPEGKGDLTDTMSLQGSCFMVTRDRFFELGLCDEEFGSWGSQGIEVAVKTWLSGGRVVCNHRTWYAHMFRTQGGDFGFPYELSGRQVAHAKKFARESFYENRWPKQVRPLSWLLDRFWPVRGWTDEERAKITEAGRDFRPGTPLKTPLAAPRTAQAERSGEPPKSPIPPETPARTKGIVYYTDNRCDEGIFRAVQRQLLRCANGNPLVSVSLEPLDFGENHVLRMERGYLTMFRQILLGLERCEAEVVFFAEHDVLYHPSHFDFTPPRDDVYYYNVNTWKVRATDGHALHYVTKQTSGLCADRRLLIEHYRKRVERVEREGFTRAMGFEPGSHGRPERVDDHRSESWVSPFPNIDIRHGHNLTWSRWRKDQFRSQRSIRGWKESDEVPGWGVTKNRFREILDAVQAA